MKKGDVLIVVRKPHWVSNVTVGEKFIYLGKHEMNANYGVFMRQDGTKTYLRRDLAPDILRLPGVENEEG